MRSKRELRPDGFGPGAFYDPRAPGNIAVQEHRYQFLQAAEAKVQIEQALRIDVYPLFEKCRSTGRDGTELKTALDIWAKRFNLYCDWGLDCALYAMSLWRERPDFPWQLGYYTAIALADLGCIVRFSPPHWNPFAESEGRYVRRAHAAWQKALQGFVTGTKAELKARGYAQLPQRRDTTGSPWRYEWLALAQCLNWEHGRIATEYTPPESTEEKSIVTTDQVSAAVHRLRQLIDLPADTRVLPKPHPFLWEEPEQQRRRFARGEAAIVKLT